MLGEGDSQDGAIYLTPDLADQLADVISYYARRARGEDLPFKYHTLKIPEEN